MAAAEQVWRVPQDHPALAGHFPGRPIVPGALLLDHAVLLAQALVGGPTRRWAVAQAKFHSPCGPGEVLAFDFRQSASGSLVFSVRCAGREVASGILATMAE